MSQFKIGICILGAVGEHACFDREKSRKISSENYRRVTTRSPVVRRIKTLEIVSLLRLTPIYHMNAQQRIIVTLYAPDHELKSPLVSASLAERKR